MKLERRGEVYGRTSYKYLEEFADTRHDIMASEDRYKSFKYPPLYSPTNYFTWRSRSKRRYYRGHSFLLTRRGCYEEDVLVSYLLQLWKNIMPDIEGDVGKNFILGIMKKTDDTEDIVFEIRKYYTDFDPNDHKTFLLKCSILKEKK